MCSFSFQPLLVTIVSGDDGNDCETHYPLCPYGKKCTYGSKCKYFHIERRYQNPLSITESLQMKARLEKSKLQHHLSNPTMMPVLVNNGKSSRLFINRSILSSLAFKAPFNHSKSGPDHLRKYQTDVCSKTFVSILEQSLADDARLAYEYGLSTTPPTANNEFSFVDQRVPMQQATRPTHHSWFGTPNQQNPFLNRAFSMPQAVNFDSQRMMEEQQQQMAAAMLMHQQQQNWARQQQMFPMQQQQPPPPAQQFEQVNPTHLVNATLILSFFLECSSPSVNVVNATTE